MLVLSAIDSYFAIPMNDEAPAFDSESTGAAAQPAHARTLPARHDPALAALVKQMAQGNQDALGRLYDETSSSVNGLLLRMLAHRQDAEEVLMDVYMKAWKNAAAYSPERASVQAWLMMMARSVAIDRIRRRSTQPDTTAVDVEDAPEPVAPETSPEEQTSRNQWKTEVLRALNELPREQRDALMLAFFEGLSHSELAARLGQPLGTVKSRVRVGLLRLREILDARRIVL
jgi:RNA polymerase sigma-70 factor (ECF subfamily)